MARELNRCEFGPCILPDRIKKKSVKLPKIVILFKLWPVEKKLKKNL